MIRHYPTEDEEALITEHMADMEVLIDGEMYLICYVGFVYTTLN
jgi:hypothetical protein